MSKLTETQEKAFEEAWQAFYQNQRDMIGGASPTFDRGEILSIVESVLSSEPISFSVTEEELAETIREIRCDPVIYDMSVARHLLTQYHITKK